MNHAFFIGSDGYIQEVFLYKTIHENEERILVLTGMKNGSEVWEEKSAADYVIVPPEGSFYKPKWTNGIWVEGMTAEEIETIRMQPVEKTEVDILREESRMNAMAIMELAEMILGG